MTPLGTILLLEELKRLDAFLEKNSSASIRWTWQGDLSVPANERTLDQYHKEMVYPDGYLDATVRRKEILDEMGWLH